MTPLCGVTHAAWRSRPRDAIAGAENKALRGVTPRLTLPRQVANQRKQRSTPMLIAIPGDSISRMLVLILPNLVVVHIAGLDRRRPILLPGLHGSTEVHLAVLLDIRLIDTVILDVDAVTRTLRPVASRVGMRQRHQRKQQDTNRQDQGFHVYAPFVRYREPPTPVPECRLDGLSG